MEVIRMVGHGANIRTRDFLHTKQQHYLLEGMDAGPKLRPMFSFWLIFGITSEALFGIS
jgi:hypothetical protein